MRSIFCAIVLALFLSIPWTVCGQKVVDTVGQTSYGLHKNSIYGNVGMAFPLVSGAASISYDRSIYRAADHSDIRLKLSVGYLGAMMAGSYNYQSLSVGLLTGSHSNHLELFAGVALNQHHMPSNSPESEQDKVEKGLFPIGNIGYRFQKPQSWFIFRTGIGFPDLAYVGVGVAF